jgi:hypothetical protein
MIDDYRRKDYFFPRTMREAFGNDETYEPEIRCCSELFARKNSNNKHWHIFVYLGLFAVAVWQVVARFGH